MPTNDSDNRDAPGFEARVARIESDVAYIKRDIADVGVDLRELRGDFRRLDGKIDANLKILMGTMLTIGLGLAAFIINLSSRIH